MDLLDKIITILASSYFFIFILPIIIGLAFYIGLYVLDRVFDINFEEPKDYNVSKLGAFVKKVFKFTISITIGITIMYFSLKIISGISHSRDTDEEMIIKR